MWWWWWRIGPRPHPDRAKHTAEATNQPHEAQSSRGREKISPQEPEENSRGSGRRGSSSHHHEESGDQPTDKKQSRIAERRKLWNSLGAPREGASRLDFRRAWGGRPGDSRGLFLLGFLPRACSPARNHTHRLLHPFLIALVTRRRCVDVPRWCWCVVFLALFRFLLFLLRFITAPSQGRGPQEKHGLKD